MFLGIDRDVSCFLWTLITIDGKAQPILVSMYCETIRCRFAAHAQIDCWRKSRIRPNHMLQLEQRCTFDINLHCFLEALLMETYQLSWKADFFKLSLSGYTKNFKTLIIWSYIVMTSTGISAHPEKGNKNLTSLKLIDSLLKPSARHWTLLYCFREYKQKLFDAIKSFLELAELQGDKTNLVSLL